MICEKCKNRLNKNDSYCTECGTKINNNDSNSNKTLYLKIKVGVLLVSLILAVVIIVVCISGNSVNSSPEELAIAVVESEYEIDIDKMVKCFPDFTIRALAKEYGLSKNANISEVIEKLEEDYRKEKPIDVEIIDAKIVDEYDVDEDLLLRGLYDPMTDKEYKSITKMVRVKVEFIANGENKSAKLMCIEIDDNWYLLRKK